MTVPENNPAGRLYTLMEAMRKQNQKGSTRQAWAATLGIPETDSAELAIGIAQVGLLLREVLETGERLEDEHGVSFSTLYKSAISKMSPVVDPQKWGATWVDLVKHVDDAAIIALGTCAEWSSRYLPETAIEHEELEKFETEIRELIQDFETRDDLPPKLLHRVLSLLKDAERAIWDYRILGAEALEHWSERGIGVMHIVYLTIGPESAEKDEDVSKLQKFIGKVANAAAAKGAKQLGEKGMEVLAETLPKMLGS